MRPEQPGTSSPATGRAPFVGRGGELRRLAPLTSGDGGKVAVIVGDPGIGKTTLLRELLVPSGDTAGPAVWWAGGDAAEASLDFGVLDQLVRAAGTSPATAAAIARAAPRGPLEVGALVLGIVDEWLTRSDAARRLVVVLDDAHVADEPSLEVLAFLARRLRGSRASLLLAARPEGVRRLPAALLHLAQEAGLMLTLGALGEYDVHVLAVSLRGGEFADAAAESIHRRTGGHPLHARILIEQAAGTGAEDIGALPASLSRLLVERSVRCGPGARSLLDALAVLGGSAELGLAAALGDVADPLAAAQELLESGLIELQHTGHVRSDATALARTRHRLLQVAIYEELEPTRRCRLHARAAGLTAGTSSLLHRVAAAVGPDPGLAADLAAQADVAAARGARVQAAQWLHTALPLAPVAAREGLLLRAADHLVAVGRTQDARLGEVAALADSALRSSILGQARLAEGRFDEARVLLEGAWERAEPTGSAPQRAVAATIAENLAVIALSRLDADEVVRWGERVAATGAPALPATLICHGLALRGQLRQAHQRADQFVRASGSTAYALADALLARGIIASWSNRLEEGIQDLERVLAGGIERSLMQVLTARSHLADAYLRAGDVRAARTAVEAALDLLQDVRATWIAPLPHSIASSVQVVLGDLDRAREHAAAAARIMGAVGNLAPAMVWAKAAQLRVADAQGDYAEAVRLGDDIRSRGLDQIPEGINHRRATYIDALCMVGRVADAERVLAELEAEVAGIADASVATQAARARATVRYRSGDPEGALAAARAGLAIDPELARPLPRALLELTAGSYLRRCGQRAAAAEQLERAAERLRSLGAPRAVEICERELAACGLRPTKRSAASPGASDLTPQELAIARLVAAGRTNREVAQTVFVSVKTVEYHLSRLYAKLGVRGRTEMAALLNSNPPLA